MLHGWLLPLVPLAGLALLAALTITPYGLTDLHGKTVLQAARDLRHGHARRRYAIRLSDGAAPVEIAVASNGTRMPPHGRRRGSWVQRFVGVRFGGCLESAAVKRSSGYRSCLRWTIVYR